MGGTCGICKSDKEIRQQAQVPQQMILLNIGKGFTFQASQQVYGSRKLYDLRQKWNMALGMYSAEDNPFQAFYNQNRSAFEKYAIQGIPPEMRLDCWKVLIQFEDSNDYTQFLQVDNDKLVNDIQKDIQRTFPELNFFKQEETQKKLFNVLKAFGNKEQEISYCQGLNFVAGFLLMLTGGDELQTYYMLIKIVNQLQIKQFYTQNLPLVQQMSYVTEQLIMEKFPQVGNHFNQAQFTAPLWLTKGIITLFIYILPEICTVRIWDVILLKGIIVIYQAFLALIEILQDKIMGEDLFGLVQMFKSLTVQQINPDKLIQTIQKFDEIKEAVDKHSEFWNNNLNDL